ncbi:peptide MFS transporter [Pseudomarimonas arenosa]|uniref:Peptide MFS transporter n=1 Tax=Pseudomarimonas arenosa TaxID=2774145 RepID=A0AAW3ZFV8_9GAMM|nr:peptide MFS transporter [Pseudomarimonas arenosa]MBD8524926.1 peptide MFS transporter [Pseudomarimonas arenosa]
MSAQMPPSRPAPEPQELAPDHHAFRPPPAGEFLGHPNALWNLFGTEFWERFMYYGMRAMLAVHVASAFFAHLGENARAEASLTYGGFTSLVYMTGILGGYVADRILGYQRSIMLGGVLMAIGCFMLMAPDLTTFLVGLAVIIVGNGLFKPNISTMVGKLYRPGDVRRDSGFTIFYMGINLGALVAPFICASIIGQQYGYRWGFFAASMGMIFGLVVFQVVKGWLGHVGTAPEGKQGVGPIMQIFVASAVLVAPVYILLSMSDVLAVVLIVLMLGLAAYFVWSGIQSGDKQQLHRYIAMLILFAANILFWALFEQAGSSLNFLAQDHVRMPDVSIFGWTPTFEVFQSVNPIFIVVLAPLFASMWIKLDKADWNPSIPRKFAYGLVGAALGFYILVFAIGNSVGDDGKISWIWLTLTYLIHTMGELCLSPIGLAMVTKLARPHETGLAMGGWFLSIAMANFVAGRIAAIASGGGGHGEAAGSLMQYADTFNQLFWLGIVIAALYFVAAPLINKLMHGVK